jgi:hypothetical protein
VTNVDPFLSEKGSRACAAIGTGIQRARGVATIHATSLNPHGRSLIFAGSSNDLEELDGGEVAALCRHAH